MADPDRLELLLVSPDGLIIRRTVPEAKRSILLSEAMQFQNAVTNPIQRRQKSYEHSAKQMDDCPFIRCVRRNAN